jgi:hypothetical protein
MCWRGFDGSRGWAEGWARGFLKGVQGVPSSELAVPTNTYAHSTYAAVAEFVANLSECQPASS